MPTGNVNLYVPAGTKDAYQAAETWSGFHIIEYDLQMSVSRDSIAISDTAGSSASFDITSSTNWQVSSGQSWLRVDPVMGMDTSVITFMAEANPDTVSREAILTVSGENVDSLYVVVIQAPRPELSLSTDSLDIGPLEGNTASFNIVSNQDWTAQSDQAWLVPSASAGYKNSVITLTAEANPDTIIREAIIIVYSGQLTPDSIRVIQAPRPVLSLSSNALAIGYQEGSQVIFHINSNTGWTLESDQSWLTANPSSGIRNGEITLTAEANPDAATREAVVTISADGVIAQTVTITQEAALPSGNKEVLSEKIEVYPNPVQDVLHVSGAAGNELIIYDISGQVVFSKRLFNDRETVDLSALPSGSYVINIGNITGKIVK